MTTLLPEKDHEETVPVTFHFTLELGAATISGTPTVDVSVTTGNDPTPATIKQGTATVAAGIATQWVTAGRPGVTYHLRCKAQTSDNRTLVIPVDLPVVRA